MALIQRVSTVNVNGGTMNPSKEAVGKMDQLQRALMVRRTLGVRAAAGYMRRKGWSLEAALWWLTRPLVGVAK